MQKTTLSHHRSALIDVSFALMSSAAPQRGTRPQPTFFVLIRVTFIPERERLLAEEHGAS